MPDTMPQNTGDLVGNADAPCLPRHLAAYSDAVTAVRDHVDDLGVSLSIWSYRDEPDAHARRSANGAMDAIDAAIRKLYSLRSQLITETRDADDASAARVDAMLAAHRDAIAGRAA